MDGIRPILATCLSAQGKHELAGKQLTDRVKVAAATDHDVAYWLGRLTCCRAGKFWRSTGCKSRSISVMKTISGLSQIQTG